MLLKGGYSVAWQVPLCTLVWFLPSVNEDVLFEVIIPDKWFIALCATVLHNPNVDLFVIWKATAACKNLCTQVTRYLFWHLQLSPPLRRADLSWLLWIEAKENFHFHCKLILFVALGMMVDFAPSDWFFDFSCWNMLRIGWVILILELRVSATPGNVLKMSGRAN